MQTPPLGNQKDYLSKENTNCLKGILAICILVHHLYQYSGLFRDGWLHLLGGCFQAFGFLAVALFFFLSGYGLMAMYRQAPRSIDHFLKNKILPFYVINLLLIALYTCVHWTLGHAPTIGFLIQSLTIGNTVIENGWYIQVQLLYYVLFFAVFRFCRKQGQLFWMLILHTAYIVICVLSGLNHFFYERTYIFVFGMVWYDHREKVDRWIAAGRYRWAILWVLSCVCFAITYGLSYWKMPVVFRGISYFFFVPSVILLLKKTAIQNRLTRFFGAISLEIYVIQGLFLTLFHNEAHRLYIANPYLYVLAVTGSTIAAACLLHPIFQWVYRTFRKI